LRYCITGCIDAGSGMSWHFSFCAPFARNDSDRAAPTTLEQFLKPANRFAWRSASFLDKRIARCPAAIRQADRCYVPTAIHRGQDARDAFLLPRGGDQIHGLVLRYMQADQRVDRRFENRADHGGKITFGQALIHEHAF
jgi:hypothetical protein